MGDFVTFDMAKKLKEKGFPQNMCNDGYITEEDDGYNIGDREGILFIPDCLPYIAAPTIYQVLKWLREEKKISVEKNFGMHPYEGSACWYCTIVKISESGVREVLDNFGETCNVFDSYEDAALAGIEYVLGII